MKLRKTLAIIACAGLLSATALGSARRAYAQDADNADPEAGAWSADEINLLDSSAEPDTAKPPLDVQGCWSGKVHDRAKGTGIFTIAFQQNGTKLEPNIGGFSVFWDSHNFAHGPIVKGSVRPNGVAFKGTATSKCAINATAIGNAHKLRGTYSFHRLCGQAFKGGTFTVAPGSC